MPRTANQLTDKALRRLTPGRHAIGGEPGLYLDVRANGTRSWVLRVTVAGKRRHRGLGRYPDVSLREAREKAHQLRKMARDDSHGFLAVGLVGPGRAGEGPVSFRQVFDTYFAEKVEPELTNAKHIRQWPSTMETYVFPMIGEKPVGEITLEDIEAVLKLIWFRIPETAKRVQGRIERTLDWATAKGLRSGENPARWQGCLSEIFPAPPKLKRTNPHPALSLDDASRWYGCLSCYAGPIVRCALQLLALTATRSGEIRGAIWEEFDLDNRIWTIPEDRTKTKREHRIPLSREAVRVLQEVRAIASAENCGGSALVFPGREGRMLSDMTLSKAMKRVHTRDLGTGNIGFTDPRTGKPAVPHGLRSTFRDWAAEKTDYPAEMAEMALGHTVGSKVERAYRRTDMFDRRRQMMEDWADFLVCPSDAEARSRPM